MTLFKKLTIGAVAAAVLAGSILQADAMPLPAAPAQVQANGSGPADVTQVQYRRWHDGGYRGGWHGRPGWYGGYRGYDNYRPGYRHYNGYWFPLAAFGAGALIGGAIASEPRYVAPAPAYPAYAGGGLNPRHYEYCAGRYRSYDPGSNTFQPNYGPRQQCYSPYY